MSEMEMVDRYAGVNLRNALDDARRLGCTVEFVDGTGEIAVSHPAWHRRVRLNSRKKSAPRKLVGFLLSLTRPEAPPTAPAAAPMIRVQLLGDTPAYVVMRDATYWSGHGWDPDPRQALVSWSRQDARAVARRLRGA
jgi:hypothetical protein